MGSSYVVVTGASRGIGLELTKHGLVTGAQVLAVARNPDRSRELSALRKEHGDRLSLLAVELSEPGAPAEILTAVTKWPRVDVLLNNAGILREEVTSDAFLESFHVNSVVPFLVTQALLPKLRASASPTAAHVTSLMGSIADNSSGGYYAYRASKAALNMINKSLSIDQPWLKSVVLHPGWVLTDMGGPSAPVSPSDSADGLWRVIGNLKPSDSGAFFDFRGRRLPW